MKIGEGGISDIIQVDIKNCLQQYSPQVGNRMTFYYRRGMKFFFRNDTGEKFVVFVSPQMSLELQKLIKEDKTIILQT
jgi:hypothetical protein